MMKLNFTPKDIFYSLCIIGLGSGICYTNYQSQVRYDNLQNNMSSAQTELSTIKTAFKEKNNESVDEANSKALNGEIVTGFNPGAAETPVPIIVQNPLPSYDDPILSNNPPSSDDFLDQMETQQNLDDINQSLQDIRDQMQQDSLDRSMKESKYSYNGK